MKKGKLFEMMEKEFDESKVKNFVIMNGKTKSYCPVSFADCESEKTKKELIDNGHNDILDSIRYLIMVIDQHSKHTK